VPEAKWRDWLAKKFADDAPWEATVRELLAADGRDASPAVKFFVDGRTEPHRLTQDVARIFLGKNLTCAQCHDHPHVKDWSQAEYMGLFAFLGQKAAFAKLEAVGLTPSIVAREVQSFPRIGYERLEHIRALDNEDSVSAGQPETIDRLVIQGVLPR